MKIKKCCYNCDHAMTFSETNVTDEHTLKRIRNKRVCGEHPNHREYKATEKRGCKKFKLREWEPIGGWYSDEQSPSKESEADV